MSETWVTKKLSEVCDLQNGFAFKSKTYVDKSNTVNIRMSNIRPDGSFNPEYNIRYLPDSFALEYKQFLLSEGDLIIAMTDMAGDPKILGLPTMVKNLNGRNFLLNQRVGKLMDFSSEVFIPFLTYYLGSPIIKEYYKSKGAGGLQLNISKKDVLTAKIPIPPHPEQKQNEKNLDQAFEAIDQAKANIEKNIANAKELFQSKLNEVFSQKGEGWEEKTLGEVAIVKSGGTPSRSKKEFWEGDIPWYSSGELNKTFTNSPDRHINQLAIENSTAKIFPKGSLLIGMYDTAALKMSILDRDGAFNQAISGVSPNKDIDLKFILHSINSIKPELLSQRRGVRQKNLNLTKIKNIPLHLPSIDDQKMIVERLELVYSESTKIESFYHKKLTSLEELKKSILQKAFSGELTNPN